MAQNSFSLLYPQYDNRLLDSSYEWQTPEPSLAEIKAKELLEASKQKEEALAKRNKDAWAQPDDGSLEYAVKQAFGALTSSAGSITGNIFTALGDVEPNALRNLLGPDDMNQYKAREEAKVKLIQLNDQLPKADPITRQALIQQQQALQQQVAQANSYLNRPIPKDKLGWYEKLITDPNETGTVGDVARAYWLRSNNALSQYGRDVVNTGLNKVYRDEGADQVEARSTQYGEKASDAWSEGNYGKAALISVQGALDNLVSNPGTAATMALESTFQTLSATNPVAAAATYGPIFLNAKTQGFTDFEKAHNGRAPNDEEKAIITGAAAVIATSDLAGDFLLTKVLPGFNKLLKKNPGALSDPMKAELVKSFARTKALAKGVGSAALAVPSEALQGGIQNLAEQYAGVQDFNKVDTATIFAEGIKEGTAAGAMGAASTLGIPGDVSKAGRDSKALQQATKAIEAFKQSEVYAAIPKATGTPVEAYRAFEKAPTLETLANAVSSIVSNPHHNLPEIAKRVQEVAAKAGMELSEPINTLLNDIQVKSTSTIGNLASKAVDAVNKAATTVRSYGTDAMLSEEGITNAPMAALDTVGSKVSKSNVTNLEEYETLKKDTGDLIKKIQLSVVRDLVKRKNLNQDTVLKDEEYSLFKIKVLTIMDQLGTIEQQLKVPDVDAAIESISTATSEQRTTDTTLGSSINVVLGSMAIGKPNKITDEQLDKLIESSALQENEKEYVRIYKEVRSKNIEDVSQDIANSAPGFKGVNSYLEDLNLAIAGNEEKQAKAILNNLQVWVAKFGRKRNDVVEKYKEALAKNITWADAIPVPKIKEGENYEIHQDSKKLIDGIELDYKLLQLAQSQAALTYNKAFNKKEIINPKVETTEVTDQEISNFVDRYNKQREEGINDGFLEDQQFLINNTDRVEAEFARRKKKSETTNTDPATEQKTKKDDEIPPKNSPFEFTLSTSLNSRVNNLFKIVPSLKEIGSTNEYIQYIFSIFPNSIVKNILYHGTLNKFDKFDKTKRGSNTGKSRDSTNPYDSELATFFSSSFNNAATYQFVALDMANKLDKQDSQALQNHITGIERHRQQATLIETNIDSILKGVRIHNPYGRQVVDFKFEAFGFETNEGTRTILRFKNNNYVLDNDFSEIPVTRENLIQFIKDVRKQSAISQKEFFNKLEKRNIVLQVLPVVVNIQNPSIVDYKTKGFVTEVAGLAMKQTQKAVADNKDAVIFKNIADPNLADSFGVFDEANIHILGTANDINGFKLWKAKQTSTQATETPTEASQKPSKAVKPSEAGKDTTEPTKTQEGFSTATEQVVEEAVANPTATQEEVVTQSANISQIVNTQDLVAKLKSLVKFNQFASPYKTLMEKFNNYLKNPRSNIKISIPKTAIILPASIDPAIDKQFSYFKNSLVEHFSTLTNYETDIADDPILHLLAIEGNKVSLPEYIVNAMTISGISYLVTQASGLIYTNERALKRMFGYANDDRLNWEAWSFAFMGNNRNSVIETLGKEAYRLSGIRVADEIDRKRMQSAMGNHILFELKKIKIGSAPIFKENAVPVLYYRKAFKEFDEVDTSNEATVHFISLNRNPKDEFEVHPSVTKLLKVYKDKLIAKKFMDTFDLSFKEIKPLTKPSTYVPKHLVGTKQKLSDIAIEVIKANNSRAYTLNKDEFTIIKKLFDDPATKPLLLKQLGYLDTATQHIEIRRGVETKNRVIERDLYALFDYVAQLDSPDTEVYFEHDVWRNQRIGLSNDSGISPQGSKFIRSLISLAKFSTEITPDKLDRFKIAVMGGFGLEFGKVPLKKFYDEFDALANDEVLNKLTKEDYAGIFKYLVDKEVEDLTHGLVSVINYLNYKEANGKPFTSHAFIEIDGKSNGPGWGIVQTQSVDKEFQYAVGVFDLVDETDFVNEVDNLKHSGAYEMIAIAWDSKLANLKNSEFFPIQERYIKSLTQIEDTIVKATKEGRNVSKPPFMKLVFGQSETSMVRDLGNTLFYLMIDAITNAVNQQELNGVLADIAKLSNTTQLEIKYADRLDTPIDDEIKQRIILSVDSTYGTTLKEIVNEKFENFKRTRDAVNAMGAFISNVFIEALQVKIYEAENTGRILTSEEIDELMYGELLPLLPAINTPNSNGDIKAGLLLLKPIVTRPKGVQVKVSYRRVNINGNLVGANQYTLYTQEQKNRKKKLVGTEQRGQSMQGNILQQSFKDAGVGPFIGGIHSADGSQMQRVMIKLDAFGVHDAIYLGVNNLFEGGKLMNQVFAEINEEYSLAQAMLDRYNEIIAHTGKKPLGTYYGLSQKQLDNISKLFTNIKEHNVGSKKKPNYINQKNTLKLAVANKNEFFKRPHNWHQFPMSTAHWVSGKFANETEIVELDEQVAEQELNEETSITNIFFEKVEARDTTIFQGKEYKNWETKEIRKLNQAIIEWVTESSLEEAYIRAYSIISKVDDQMTYSDLLVDAIVSKYKVTNSEVELALDKEPTSTFVDNFKATSSKYSNVESTEQENQDALKAITCIKGNK